MDRLGQIMAGYTRLTLNGTVYMVGHSVPSQTYELEAVYEEAFRANQQACMLTEEAMLQVLYDRGIWTVPLEQEFHSLPKTIKETKVSLYNSWTGHKGIQTKQLRAKLKNLNSRHEELYVLRSSHLGRCCERAAAHQQIMHQIRINIEPVPIDVKIELLVNQFLSEEPTEHDIRDAALSGEWMSIWGAGKAEGSVFGKPASMLTHNQLNLINWSRTLDNVMNHPEKPAEEVIRDHDMLDGWIIVQARKSEENKKAASTPPGQSGEIYIPAETSEDASRVYKKNVASSEMIIKRREAALEKRGALKEQHLPDAKLRMLDAAKRSK